MNNTQKIRKTSRRLKHTCTAIIVLQPIICALFWIFINWIFGPNSPAPTSMIPLPVPITQELPAMIKFLAFLTELIPLAAATYALLKLRELFKLYEQGIIFTDKNVACFHFLGRALIIWVFCHVVANALLSMVLTISNPPGQHILTIGMSSSDFCAIFVGIVILIISWVMDEARKIQEDHALII